jgi:hypothetical protein
MPKMQKTKYFWVRKFRKFEEKAKFLGFSTMVLNPLKIQGKNSKKNFLGNKPGTKSLFWAKKFFKFFFAAFGTRYYHRKKNKKTRKRYFDHDRYH